MLERPGMHVIHECKLLKARLDIVRQVHFSDVKQSLRSTGIIDRNLSQKIEQETTDSDKTGELLDLLVKRGPKAYTAFRQALLDNGMGWVADHLDEMDITVDDLRDHHFVGEDVGKDVRPPEKEENTAEPKKKGLKAFFLLRKRWSLSLKDESTC